MTTMQWHRKWDFFTALAVLGEGWKGDRSLLSFVIAQLDCLYTSGSQELVPGNELILWSALTHFFMRLIMRNLADHDQRRLQPAVSGSQPCTDMLLATCEAICIGAKEEGVQQSLQVAIGGDVASNAGPACIPCLVDIHWYWWYSLYPCTSSSVCPAMSTTYG